MLKKLLSLEVPQKSILSTMSLPQPSKIVSGTKIDVWSLINGAAAEAENESGKPVVNLGQGFFSYSPPQFSIDALKKAVDNPALNQYSPTRGRPELLKAISTAYSPFFGRKLDPTQEIVVTAGANEAILSSFFAFLDPGDEAIIFEPFFDQYIPNIQMCGATVKYVPINPPEDADLKVTSGNDWYIDFEALEAAVTSRTKVLVLNSPHNPIGKVFSREELLRIGNICVTNNIVIVSDEVYDRLYYSEFTRIATLSPEIAKLVITVCSAGKTFACTGWRVGWAIGQPHLIKAVAAANTRIIFSTNTPCQAAVAESFARAEELNYYDNTIEAFKKKYAILLKALDQLGLPYSVAEGGYFLLVNFSRVQIPSDFEFDELIQSRPRDFKLAIWLIKTFGVVTIPPTEFATPSNAPLIENWLRFAVCKDDKMLEDAAERLKGLESYIRRIQ